MVATGALISLLGSKLKYLGKLKSTNIDSPVFKLHYRWTVNFLFVACAIVTSTQFFGEPISCINSAKKEAIKPEIINNYCWLEGTFTIPSALTKRVGSEVVFPGIDKTPIDFTSDILVHKYYQWVWWVLFLQALAFYVTRILWKKWENGIVSKLIEDLNGTILNAEKKKKKSTFLAKFLEARKGTFNHYANKYLFCEIYNFIHVIVEIVITDTFLGGHFLDYGYMVAAYSGDFEEINPMTKMFPKMTKCTFHVWGPSGGIEKLDNFCLLPLNIINEKIYLFLWIWYIFLTIVSSLSVFYRLFVCIFPPCRARLLRIMVRKGSKECHIALVEGLSYGDWFILSMIAQNIEKTHFHDVVQLLAELLNGETRPEESESTSSEEKPKSTELPKEGKKLEESELSNQEEKHKSKELLNQEKKPEETELPDQEKVFETLKLADKEKKPETLDQSNQRKYPAKDSPV